MSDLIGYYDADSARLWPADVATYATPDGRVVQVTDVFTSNEQEKSWWLQYRAVPVGPVLRPLPPPPKQFDEGLLRWSPLFEGKPGSWCWPNRDDEAYWSQQKPYDDKLPYFTDPQPIGFHPEVACRQDNGTGESNIPFRRIWRDQLARTFFIAIKARHLTSQHFRPACLSMARWARSKPPQYPENLSITTGESFGTFSERFRAELWPYVVRILIFEKRWPYFVPGGLPKSALRWSYANRKDLA